MSPTPEREAHTTASGNRLGHVQGLRAVAVLLVVVYHTGLSVGGGYVGVDVFFVISGFVITALLVRERTEHGRSLLTTFYLRRIRRLLPAFATMMVATVLASTLFQSPFGSQQATGRIGAYASVFFANGALYSTRFGYFDAQANAIPLLHTWSLGVEEQFYVGFPALVAIAYVAHRTRPLLALRLLIVSMSMVSLALFLAMSRGYAAIPFLHRAQEAAFYSPITRLWEFGVGALLAVWFVTHAPLRRLTAIGAGTIGAALVGYAAITMSGGATPVQETLVLPVAGAALLIAAGRTADTPVQRILALPAMQWLGDTSYSWYLWHWPLIVFAAIEWPDNSLVSVLAALVALAVARLSYRTVEQTFRYRGRREPPRRFARSTGVLAAVCVLVPATLSVGLNLAARHGWGSAKIQSMAKQVTTLPHGYAAGCSVGVPINQLTSCTIGADEPGRPIYLIGDSNAGQYTEALVGVGAAMHRPLVLATHSGCSFIDVAVQRRGYDAAACSRAVTTLTDYLRRQPPTLVVLGSVNTYIDASGVTLGDPQSGRVGRDPATKQEIWSHGLTRTLNMLRSAGDTVLMIGVLPHPGGADATGVARWSPTVCPWLTVLRDVSDCGLAVSLAAQDRDQARALAAERSAVSRSGVAELNLRSAVCPRGQCVTNIGNYWVFRDGEHITARESAMLEPIFERALRAAQSRLLARRR